MNLAFSKTFPKTTDKSVYPKWIEVYLTDLEEREEELNARKKNIEIMKECVDDAKKIIDDKNLTKYQSDLVSIATALFEKRASHEIYWKENKAKEKFDKENLKKSP